MYTVKTPIFQHEFVYIVKKKVAKYDDSVAIAPHIHVHGGSRVCTS